MHSIAERIEAEGLSLRPMDQGDLATLVDQLGKPEIGRWMAALRHPFTGSDAAEILELAQDPAQCLRVIEVAGRMVGCLRLAPEIWFWLDPAMQGQGLMSRALHAAISACFTRPAPPLFATCRQDNHAAQAVLIRLGFSQMPLRKRMFFHSEGRAMPCRDHVLSCEQWLLLHPPTLTSGQLVLRPALQKDIPAMLQMLPRKMEDQGCWPPPDGLHGFVEAHRCRRPGCGLFIVLDHDQRSIGMALLEDGPAIRGLRFLTAEDAARHAADVARLFP